MQREGLRSPAEVVVVVVALPYKVGAAARVHHALYTGSSSVLGTTSSSRTSSVGTRMARGTFASTNLRRTRSRASGTRAPQASSLKLLRTALQISTPRRVVQWAESQRPLQAHHSRLPARRRTSAVAVATVLIRRVYRRHNRWRRRWIDCGCAAQVCTPRHGAAGLHRLGTGRR